MKKIYSFLIFLACAYFAQAQKALPYHESFNYAAGVLANQNGWGASGALATVDPAVNLTYPGLSTDGSTANSLYFGQMAGTNTQPLGIVSQTGTVYVSFLMQVASLPYNKANSRYNVGFGSTTAGGTFAGTLWVITNDDGTTFELGFHGSNTTPLDINKTSQQFTPGTTIMVVMAYTPGASGAGKIDAWVNPAATDFGASTTPTPTFANVIGGNVTSVASFFIRCGTTGTSGANPMNMDDLRLGTSWAEVTPVAPLPVKLGNFSIASSGTQSILNWTSLTEENFNKYVVLFSSNGTNFTEVGTVKGKGNNQQYTFSYAHQNDGYFALRMVDIDGKVELSKTLFARGRAAQIKVGPNPFVNQIYFTNMPLEKYVATLYNTNGAVVVQQTLEGSSVMNIKSIPAGNYILKVMQQNKIIYSGSVVKQ